MTEQDELLYTLNDGIALVTLNRPQRRNALTPKLTHLLADTWKRIDADPLSVMAGKKVLKEATTLGCEPGLQQAWDYFEKYVYSSEDAIEGPKAFAAGRTPDVKGR